MSEQKNSSVVSVSAKEIKSYLEPTEKFAPLKLSGSVTEHSSGPPTEKIFTLGHQGLSHIQTSLNSLEENFKSFIEMQCTMNEEMLNFFEAFLMKMEDLTQHIQKNSAEEKYQIVATINREKFLGMLSYFSHVKNNGILKLEMPAIEKESKTYLEIQFQAGDIVFLQYFHQGEDTEIKKSAQRWEKFRIQYWKDLNNEQINQVFLEMISRKTQYLGGVSRVIQQMTREQLVNKIFSLAYPSLLYEKEDQSYSGEAVFYYAMEKWPQKGLGSLNIKFCEKEFPITAKHVKISVSGILDMLEHFLYWSF